MYCIVHHACGHNPSTTLVGYGCGLWCDSLDRVPCQPYHYIGYSEIWLATPFKKYLITLKTLKFKTLLVRVQTMNTNPQLTTSDVHVIDYDDSMDLKYCVTVCYLFNKWFSLFEASIGRVHVM